MEHCVAQELYQFVKQQLAGCKDQRLLPEAEVAVFVRQLAHGIKCMQERGIMHRDLKLSNILVTEESPRTLKIIDFGLAVQLQDFDEERQTLCGTPNYISPEVIQNKPYGLQTDLWSLGCIMFALLTGTPPFECATVQDTLVRIKAGKFKLPQGLSANACDLIQRLLTQDPQQRLHITDVLDHSFLKLERAPVDDQRLILEDLAYITLDPSHHPRQ